jgi:hypothetical protein
MRTVLIGSDFMRGVGYDAMYYEPHTDVAAISGTKTHKGEIDGEGNIK